MKKARAGLSRQGAYGLAILIVAGAIAALAAWLPFYWQGLVAEQADTARRELRFVEARINAAKGASRPHLSAGDDVTPLFLKGATAGLSLADLQTRVSAIAMAAHVTIARSQPLQTDRQSGLAVLRSEVEASGSIENLRDFLIALEAGEPLIFVDQAQISAPAVAASEGSVALPSENLSALLQIEAYGWWEAAP